METVKDMAERAQEKAKQAAAENVQGEADAVVTEKSYGEADAAAAEKNYGEADAVAEEQAKQEDPEEIYQAALAELDILDVLLLPKEVAGAYRRAYRAMKSLGDYKDAPQKAAEFYQQIKQAKAEGKEKMYQQGQERMNRATSIIERNLAIATLQKLNGYKDSQELIQECKRRNMQDLRRQDLQNLLIVGAFVLIVIVLFICMF